MIATAALALQFHLHSEFMVVGTGICMLLDAVSDIWMWKKLEALIIQDMNIMCGNPALFLNHFQSVNYFKLFNAFVMLYSKRFRNPFFRGIFRISTIL